MANRSGTKLAPQQGTNHLDGMHTDLEGKMTLRIGWLSGSASQPAVHPICRDAVLGIIFTNARRRPADNEGHRLMDLKRRWCVSTRSSHRCVHRERPHCRANISTCQLCASQGMCRICFALTLPKSAGARQVLWKPVSNGSKRLDAAHMPMHSVHTRNRPEQCLGRRAREPSAVHAPCARFVSQCCSGVLHSQAAGLPPACS